MEKDGLSKELCLRRAPSLCSASITCAPAASERCVIFDTLCAGPHSGDGFNRCAILWETRGKENVEKNKTTKFNVRLKKLSQMNKAAHSGFETKRKRLQKSKTGVSGPPAPHKKKMYLPTFFKKRTYYEQ